MTGKPALLKAQNAPETVRGVGSNFWLGGGGGGGGGVRTK